MPLRGAFLRDRVYLGGVSRLPSGIFACPVNGTAFSEVFQLSSEQIAPSVCLGLAEPEQLLHALLRIAPDPVMGRLQEAVHRRER